MQFDKAEYASAAPAKTCVSCHSPTVDQYFEVGGRIVCSSCSDGLRLTGTGAKAFARAGLFGGVAALLGTVVWFAIIKLANMEIGLIAVGVGVLVGMAVRRGGRGLGGWKYQVLAMCLTYTSIISSYLPFVMRGLAQSGAGSTAFPVVLALSFAAPFFAGNVMGLIIIGIALYEAWKLNRRVPITGPFQIGNPVLPATVASPGST